MDSSTNGQASSSGPRDPVVRERPVPEEPKVVLARGISAFDETPPWGSTVTVVRERMDTLPTTERMLAQRPDRSWIFIGLAAIALASAGFIARGAVFGSDPDNAPLAHARVAAAAPASPQADSRPMRSAAAPRFEAPAAVAPPEPPRPRLLAPPPPLPPEPVAAPVPVPVPPPVPTLMPIAPSAPAPVAAEPPTAEIDMDEARPSAPTPAKRQRLSRPVRRSNGVDVIVRQSPF